MSTRSERGGDRRKSYGKRRGRPRILYLSLGIHRELRDREGGKYIERKTASREKEKEKKREKEREAEDEGTLGYKLSGDDSIAYRPLGSPEEVFRVLLRYTILYEERSYEGVQVTNTPQLCQLELVVVQLF